MTVTYATATKGPHGNNAGEMVGIATRHFEDAGLPPLPTELAMAPNYTGTITLHPSTGDTRATQGTTVIRNPDDPAGDFVMSRWMPADVQPNKRTPSLTATGSLGVTAVVAMFGADIYKDDYSWLSSHILPTEFLLLGGLVCRAAWHYIRAMRR